MFEPDALNTPLFVKADFIGDAERVAFAGQNHVVVTVEAQFCRAACDAGGQRGGDGDQVALRFLAAKSAPHAPDFDGDLAERQREVLSHNLLHL